MAHFEAYAVCKGVTPRRCTGTKRTGIVVTATSWDGVIQVSMWHENGVDMVRITGASHPTDHELTAKVLYSGPVKGTRGGP